MDQWHQVLRPPMLPSQHGLDGMPQRLVLLLVSSACLLLARVAYVVMLRVGRPRRPRDCGSGPQGIGKGVGSGSGSESERGRGRGAAEDDARERLRCMVVLGSGGHTAEMLNLVAALDLSRYSPRTYIAAATDSMSLARARTLEQQRSAAAADGTTGAKAAAAAASSAACGESKAVSQAGEAAAEASYVSVYRSREVGQSYVTSVVTTLIAMAHAAWIVAATRPDLVLCNGPGTCLPICIAGFALRVFGIRDTRLVYVESVARVKKLSLTGRILYSLGIADQLIVQWPELVQTYRGSLYVGRLM